MIKFLKKFKDKILIALACSFIAIGTLLNNTINTYASEYETNQFSYTLTNYTFSNNNFYFDFITPITVDNSTFSLNEYVFICNANIITPSTQTYVIFFYLYINGSYTLYYQQNVKMAIYSKQCLVVSFTTPSLQNNDVISKCYIRCSNISSISNADFINKSDLVLGQYVDSYYSTLQQQYDSLLQQYDTLQAEYTSYQNTHAYTNEQYNSLMSQNVTLTQQVQTLQSQYDTYVSLHSYTNEQYETLLTYYNTLQNMYNTLQNNYLQLQTEYNRLTIDLAPFNSSIWGNRQATLNGVSIDVSSSANLNSIVWFRDSYLQIDQREFENFSSYIEGDNSFQLVTTSDSIVTINSYTAIANFSATNDYGFSIEFYLNNTLVNTTTFFDGSMTSDDGGTTNTFNYNAPITFNKMIIDIVGGPGPSSWTESSYFKANPGTWQMGYDYAVEQLQPRIDILEDSLEQAINKQQVRYSEGYNEGFDARIIRSLYMV